MKPVVPRLLPLLFLLTVPACLLPQRAEAQTPSIEFTAKTLVGAGSVTPELSWSTTPAARDCTASGDWSGAKGASGQEALPAVTRSSTFNLVCTWGGYDAVLLNWAPPSVHTDGTPLTDLAGYRIYYSASASMSKNTVVSVANPGTTSYKVKPLTAGTWYFVMSAIDSQGLEGDRTGVLAQTVDGASSSVSRTVGIVVSPKIARITGFTATPSVSDPPSPAP